MTLSVLLVPFSLLAAAAPSSASPAGHGAAEAAHPAAEAAGSLGHGAASNAESLATTTGLDGLTIGAVLLFFAAIVLVSFLAPRFVEATSRQSKAAGKKYLHPATALRSFSSGLAVAYVFVLLLPEFAVFQSKLVIPFLNSFQLALLGLVVYKGLQHFCLLVANKRSASMGDWAFVQSKQDERLLGFRVSTFVFVIYASLVLLTLPFQLHHFESLVDKILYLVTFFLHLAFNLVGLFEEDERHYSKFVPYVVSGFLAFSLVLTLCSVLSTGVLLTALAFLAGIIIFSVFRNELPTAEKSSFLWFSVGVAFFAVSVAITAPALPH